MFHKWISLPNGYSYNPTCPTILLMLNPLVSLHGHCSPHQNRFHTAYFYLFCPHSIQSSVHTVHQNLPHSHTVELLLFKNTPSFTFNTNLCTNFMKNLCRKYWHQQNQSLKVSDFTRDSHWFLVEVYNPCTMTKNYHK